MADEQIDDVKVNVDDLDPREDFKVVVEGSEEDVEPSDESEPDEYKGLSREQIVAKIASDRKAVEEQSKQAPNIAEAIKSGFTSFAETFKPQQMPQEQQPKFDAAKFDEELKDKLLETPTAMLDKHLAAKVGPEMNRIYQYNMNTSKRFLMIDEGRKDTAKQYIAEIEKEVEAIPLQQKAYDPDVYAKAHDTVVARHFNEIVDKKVKEAVEKVTSKEKQTSASASVPFRETQVTRPGGQQRVVKLTSVDVAEIARLKRIGMDVSTEDYAKMKYGGTKK
jgi:hypothetical protein